MTKPEDHPGPSLPVFLALLVMFGLFFAEAGLVQSLLAVNGDVIDTNRKLLSLNAEMVEDNARQRETIRAQAAIIEARNERIEQLEREKP